MRSKEVLINFLISAFFVPRIVGTWKYATINRINREGVVIPCPYCGSKESERVSRWPIADHFGLFDDQVTRLKTIYAIDIPFFVPQSVVARYRSVALRSISDRSYVDYRKCKDCDLVFQNCPHTTESVNFYYKKLYRLLWEKVNNGTDAVVYGRDDQRWVEQQRLIGKYFLNITHLPKGSKIIDVGCAEGIVCKYLDNMGMVAFGIEPSLPMANYAKLLLKLDNVICGDYRVDSFPPHFFDGIITHHTAEHVLDVREFFEGLSKHLKVGGYLLIQVPCLDNLKTKEDRQKILQGAHIYCFSERFLRNILDSKKFDIVECKKTPCNLAELDRSDLTPWETTVWADDPCGISILARKI